MKINTKLIVSNHKRLNKARLACDFETTQATWNKEKYKTYYMAEKNNETWTEPKVIQWSCSFFLKFWDHLPKEIRKEINEDKNFLVVKTKPNNTTIISIVGVNIDTFMFLCFLLTSCKKIDFLFNNLMSFDGTFIEFWASQNLNLLLPFDNLQVVNECLYNDNINDDYAEKKLQKIIKVIYKKHVKKEKLRSFILSLNDKQYHELRKYYNNIEGGEYVVQTDESNKYFSIKIGSSKNLVIFKCSYRLWLSSIKKLGEIVNLPKLEQNYDDYKELKYPNEIQKNELNYVVRDTEILLLADKFLCEEFCKITDLTINDIKLTSASLAFWTWQNFFLNDLIKQNKIIKINWHGTYYKWKDTKKMFNKKQMIKHVMRAYFPISKEKYDMIKNAYSGGITKVNEDYRGVKLDCVKFDEKSAYPSVMASNKKCPYGYIYTKNEDEFKKCKWFYYKIICVKNIELKRLSVMSIKHADKRLEWIQKILINDQFIINEDKYQWLKKHIKNVKQYFIIEKIYGLKTKPMNYFFGSYVNTIYDKKKECDEKKRHETDTIKLSILETQRHIYKLLINSLYGKYGSKYLHTSKFIYYDNYIKLNSYSPNLYYIPIANAITTHAQINLSDGVGDQYNKFVYSDTDSITMLSNFDRSKIKIGIELGEWEIEEEDINVIVRRPKQYAYFKGDYIDRDKNGLKLTFASVNTSRIPQEFTISKDQFLNGVIIPNQLSNDNANFKKFLFINTRKIPHWKSGTYQKLREEKK